MEYSPIFKRAFVRGLNAQLIRDGVVVYPSKEAADATADYIADNHPALPDPYLQGDQLDMKIAAVVIEDLMQGAELQCKEAGDKYSPALTKTAQAQDPAAWAQDDALALMEKSAAEARRTPNTLAAAAQHLDMAADELAARPQGYAQTGPGKYQKTHAPVGKERAPTNPGRGNNRPVPGHNSVSRKSAGLQDIIRQVSKTATLGVAGPNTLSNAAGVSDMVDAELRERPPGYANAGGAQGKTDFNIPPDAQTGKEKEHEEVVPTGGASENSATAMVGGKTAFDHLFETTAREILPYLPTRLDDNQKVAHVRAMMGLETHERADYLATMYASLGAKKEASASVRDHYLKAASDKDEDDEDGRKKQPAGEVADRPADEQEGASMAEEREIPGKRKKDASAQGPSLSVWRQRLKNLHT